MKPIETKIWRELELFAQAMQRGASVHLGDGNTVVPSGDPTGIHVSASVLRQYPILKIIEPTVLRDWTAEDAKKHVGFVARKGGMFVIVPGHAHSQFVWAGHEYAAPIPGTDPAKWDWKPCKVEVQAETPKTDPKTVAAIRLANLWVRISGFRSLGFHPPAAVNSHLAEIIEIKNLLEQS